MLTRRARRRRARARPRAHPRHEPEPAAGTHLRLARSRQDRVPQARRAHVRRAVRRDRRRPSAQFARARRRSRDAATGWSACCEKGLSALESLLFAKYQMYRNVYWHHAVRSATAMYKRLVDDALRAGVARCARRCASFNDEGLLHELGAVRPAALLGALRERRLYKRVLRVPGGGAAARRRASGSPTTARSSSRWRTARARARTRARRAAARLPDEDADARPRPPRAAPRRRGAPPDRRRVGRRDQPARSCRRSSTGVARWLRVFACRPVSVSHDAIARLATLSGGRSSPQARARVVARGRRAASAGLPGTDSGLRLSVRLRELARDPAVERRRRRASPAPSGSAPRARSRRGCSRGTARRSSRRVSSANRPHLRRAIRVVAVSGSRLDAPAR